MQLEKLYANTDVQGWETARTAAPPRSVFHGGRRYEGSGQSSHAGLT